MDDNCIPIKFLYTNKKCVSACVFFFLFPLAWQGVLLQQWRRIIRLLHFIYFGVLSTTAILSFSFPQLFLLPLIHLRYIFFSFFFNTSFVGIFTNQQKIKKISTFFHLIFHTEFLLFWVLNF